MRRIKVQRLPIRRRFIGRSASTKPIVLQITLTAEAVTKLAAQFPTPAESTKPALRPILRPWVEMIDQMVKDDRDVPKGLRTSVMRIFQKLREEHGYLGCYNVIQEYVREARNPSLVEATT